MRVEEQVVIERSAQKVWDTIADAANWRRFMSGLSRWEPVDSAAEVLELGSRVQMRMHAGSAEVGGLIEVVEFLPPGDLAWNNITGLDHRGRWRVRERSRGETTVTLRLAYQAPGGLLGAVSDRISAPIVRRNIRESLDRLKRQVEGDSLAPLAAELAPSLLDSVGHRVGSVRVLAGAGLIRPIRPDRLVRSVLALVRWGPSPAAGYEASAVRYPHNPALIDELGMVTFEEVHRRSNALANSLAEAGVEADNAVAIMCRNHRYFVETTLALSKLGAHALYLNTGFAGPQLADVVKREKPVAIVHDEEFEELLSDARGRRKRFVAWHDGEPGATTIEELIERGDDSSPEPPEEPGRSVILTSGTTGAPKGANRKAPESIDPALTLLDRIPLHAREVTHIAAPLFHSWGFAHFTVGLLLSSTYVLQRRFDPEATLAAIARHRASALVVVPVMLQRILDLPEEVRHRYDLSSLRVVAASGSALPGELAVRFMDEFGDILFNLYGSTEVAWATIAGPEDLRAAPGTAGRAPRGTILKILDEGGAEVPTGDTGRIFVANEMLFEGYTSGGNKEVVDGLMSTGDVGRVDEAGRLFVQGRDDEMIVSGGENVFPREVEDLLSNHDSVADVAVIGVDDEKFGQRLKAFVVPRGRKKPSADELKKHVKANLANYKVPREVEFLDELPRNQTGKVLKRELAER